MTGCAAQTEPETYAAMPEVDAVLGNQDKFDARAYADFGEGALERVRVNDIMGVRDVAPQLVDHFEGKTRAFLQVQTGCDHRCTFCIIPYGRGNSRSVAMGAVVSEARRLAENGFAEIVLTGVDLTSYGADLPGQPTLGQLVAKLLKLVPELKRLRLSSIDSIEADPFLMRAIAEEEKLMPHFHLSVQSGDDLILKRMKRRHSRADTIRFCDEVRSSQARRGVRRGFYRGLSHRKRRHVREQHALGGRSRSQPSCMCSLIPPRKGTPAARMPQLGHAIAKARGADCAQKAKRCWTPVSRRQWERSVPCWWKNPASAIANVLRRSGFRGPPRQAASCR